MDKKWPSYHIPNQFYETQHGISIIQRRENLGEEKNNPGFDVTMGSFDGAETSELVGLYLLSKVSKIIDNARLGLYRDDGLALITNCSGRKLDRIRKKLHQTFKDEGLKITVDCRVISYVTRT